MTITLRVTATSTPIPHRDPYTYRCGRCGIIRPSGGNQYRTGFCRDCLPEARAMGWTA